MGLEVERTQRRACQARWRWAWGVPLTHIYETPGAFLPAVRRFPTYFACVSLTWQIAMQRRPRANAPSSTAAFSAACSFPAHTSALSPPLRLDPPARRSPPPPCKLHLMTIDLAAPTAMGRCRGTAAATTAVGVVVGVAAVPSSLGHGRDTLGPRHEVLVGHL